MFKKDWTFVVYILLRCVATSFQMFQTYQSPNPKKNSSLKVMMPFIWVTNRDWGSSNVTKHNVN